MSLASLTLVYSGENTRTYTISLSVLLLVYGQSNRSLGAWRFAALTLIKIEFCFELAPQDVATWAANSFATSTHNAHNYHSVGGSCGSVKRNRVSFVAGLRAASASYCPLQHETALFAAAQLRLQLKQQFEQLVRLTTPLKCVKNFPGPATSCQRLSPSLVVAIIAAY